MWSTINFTIIVLIATLVPSGLSQKSLEVVILNTTLPTPMTYTTAVYDGDDAIYVIGGDISSTPWVKSDAVYKFSLTTQSFKLFVRLPEGVYTGDAVWDPDTKSIFYFNGASEFVYKISTITAVVETVGDLGRQNYLMFTTACISSTTKKAYAFGLASVRSEDFFELDTVTNSIRMLPGVFPEAMAGLNSIYDEERGHVYFIGGRRWETSVELDTIYRFNPSNNSLELLPTRLPFPQAFTEGVWDGVENAYIFDTDNTVRAGLMRFNVRTQVVTYLPVDHFVEHAAFRMGTALVPKLNRIYLFGGNYENWWEYATDRIQYIQLA